MSHNLNEYFRASGVAAPLPEEEAKTAAGALGELSGLHIYPRSITAFDGMLCCLGRQGEAKRLVMVASDASRLSGFASERSEPGAIWVNVCETSPGNAAALRAMLPFLNPRLLGLRKSAGCGDRLGLATPGHIRAIRSSTMAPILAQQSIRENARTGRTPQEVMDDALWGILQEGWRDGFGADADHLKNTADIDSCAAAGFTFYTIDPGEHVDNEANFAPPGVLRPKVAALPWAELETTWDETRAALGARPIDLGHFSHAIGEEDLLRAAAKYGRVVAHTLQMYRHLERVMGERPFELEMSVDETETVTTLAEHIYIAHELRRLGVKWVSLAPRYVGDFEKGVDYIGDPAAFEASFAQHLAVSQRFGPYKLSLHSGSDKFSVYPIASRVAGRLVHLKTAGTSYLEALRAIGVIHPALFREIVAFARTRYPIDRASYHVSAEPARMLDETSLADAELTRLLDDFHAREILHVTFGSVLHHPDFRGPFFAALRSGEDVYASMLETHFGRHFAPFSD
jgi:tagaturonate epimerase